MLDLTVMRCATCGLGCSTETSRRYVIGPLDGRICAACEETLGVVLTRWMAGRAGDLLRAATSARTLRLIDREAANG